MLVNDPCVPQRPCCTGCSSCTVASMASLLTSCTHGAREPWATAVGHTRRTCYGAVHGAQCCRHAALCYLVQLTALCCTYSALSEQQQPPLFQELPSCSANDVCALLADKNAGIGSNWITCADGPSHYIGHMLALSQPVVVPCMGRKDSMQAEQRYTRSRWQGCVAGCTLPMACARMMLAALHCNAKMKRT
jgi:hypothetical protein